MLVDIVQTFDEQAFDDQGGTPGDRAEQETRQTMSAMVMGPAMATSVRSGNASGVRAARTAPAPAGHLRLTARGRAVLWVLAALVVALVPLLGSQASADGPAGAQEVVRHVVQPGETLWGIAESVAAPSQDVRDVVVDLVRLNELPEAGLMAGQVIVVPAD
jgi:nucleoid-associated protein YgaU